ncbi:hypothetical protein KY289_026625 [Solanum tuberosum]|nr:hypothetical protein KY289_026625 [Solanum tuberosum]
MQKIESTDDETTPILSIENFSNTYEKITTEESTTPEPTSTSPIEKTGTPKEWRHIANYPNHFIMGKPTNSIQTRALLRKQASVALVSQLETKRINEAMEDESWRQAMKEELDQFETNQIWTLTE